MSLVEWILGRRDSKLIKEHADQLVNRYTGIVRKASLATGATLPKAEARGYVRAKAMSVLTDALEQLARSSRPIPWRIIDVVRTLSAERIVVSVMDDIAREGGRTTRRRAA